MTPDTDCVIIGAGVVGLAIARAVALTGQSVFLLEAEDHFGTGISSRNSEVIHAGIYYPQGSLKARFCVEGKRKLYDYCRDRHIPYSNCGKYIVATNEAEETKLAGIRQHADNNGVDDLVLKSGAEVIRAEPSVNAVSALFSPSTGIVDSHSFMQSLLGDLENAGGMAVFYSRVKGATIETDYIAVHMDDADNTVLTTRRLINAGGLRAQAIANNIRGYDVTHIPKLYYVPGRYYALGGRAPFTHLIYPVPVDGGLGVHATLDLSGQVKFGPDARWSETEDYSVPEDCPEGFISAIRRYYPDLEASRLRPDYAGIRPKLAAPGEGFKDFVVQTHDTHGVPGLVNLFGIESPGLTSALAIGDYVAATLAT